MRVTNGLMSALNVRSRGDEAVRVDTLYDEERERLQGDSHGRVSKPLANSSR